MLHIPVGWNGKQSYFLVDTGCSTTVLDKSAFPQLQPQETNVNVATSAGRTDFSFFNPPDLRVGVFELENFGAVVRTDLSAKERMSKKPVIGILGMSALNEFILQIDFDSRKFRFLMPDHRPHPDWGEVVPMVIGSSRNAFVRVQIAGIEESFEIDTGADGSAHAATEAV